MPNKHGDLIHQRFQTQYAHYDTVKKPANNQPIHVTLGLKPNQVTISRYRSRYIRDGFVYLIRPSRHRAIRVHTNRLADENISTHLAFSRAYRVAIRCGWKNVIATNHGISNVSELNHELKNATDGNEVNLPEFIDGIVFGYSQNEARFPRSTINSLDLKYVK